MELTPMVLVGKIEMPLAAFCHSVGIDAYNRARGTQDERRTIYFDAYYAVMRRVVPNHPAVIEHDA